MIIENEFAAVRVEFDTESHDPRLKVEDLNSGMCIYLDALELQGIAWARHEDLRRIVQPEFRENAIDRLVAAEVQGEVMRQAESILRDREDP